MHYIKKIIQLSITTIIFIVLVIPIVYSKQHHLSESNEETDFHKQIKSLTGTLLENLLKQENIKTKKSIILSQLLFEPTGEFIMLEYIYNNGYAKKLEVIIGNTINNSKYFSVRQMSEYGIKSLPDYIMRGLIKLENENYHIYYSITNRETGKISTMADVLIPMNQNLSLEQYLVYKNKNWGNKDIDSIYKIKFGYGQNLERPIQKTQNLHDCYLLEGIIQDALNNYQNGDYKLALKLFERASRCPEEQKIISHLGMAQCYKHLDKPNYYKRAQERIAEISTFRKNFEIYFEFSSYELDKDAKNILISVGRAIRQNNNCYSIIGHTDILGTDIDNYHLSVNRANKVNNFIITYFHDLEDNIKEVIGLGSSVCKMCGIKGLDKAQDRRVEFKVVDCK